MGQVLHAKARTTYAVRREIYNSQESIIKTAKKFNVNPKTVVKWKKRKDPHDLPMGPKNPGSKVLLQAEEEVIVAFRKMTGLGLDDVFYALKESIPRLTRSNLHRCLKRYGCSVLQKPENTREKKKFKAYPIGYFHVDIAEVKTAEGKMYLYVAIDRTSKFTYAHLYQSPTKEHAAEFLRNLIKSVPYKISKILTDNGIQFTNHDHHKHALPHIFDCICQDHSIEHRKTKIKHPWTNGQVERMNKTLKQATVHSFYYDSHQQLKEHLYTYLMVYNFARPLNALKGKTPWLFILDQWTKSPELFIVDPNHFLVGLNNYLLK